MLKNDKSDNPLLELYISFNLDGHENIIHLHTVLSILYYYFK